MEALLFLVAAAAAGFAAFRFRDTIRELFQGKLAPTRREQYSLAFPREHAADAFWKIKKEQLIVAAAVVTGGVLLALFAPAEAEDTTGNSGIIARPDFAAGDLRVHLQVKGENEDEAFENEVALSVGERRPDEERLNALFEEGFAEGERLLTAGNASAEKIEHNLDLPEEIGDYLQARWKSDAPEYLSSYGRIAEEVPAEGVEVHMKLTLTFQDVESERTFALRVYPKADERSFRQRLESYLQEEAEKGEAEAHLPSEFEGYTLAYAKPEGTSARVGILMLSLCGAVLLYVSRGKKLEQALELRKESLERDYPEIVSKLTLYFSAGMTIRTAWERMVQEYENAREQTGCTRYGYEEMRRTLSGMQTGTFEGEAYGQFGRRCGSYGYLKLGTLLEENVRTGLADLPTLLETEVNAARDMRLLQAKQMGEKAKTKLLLPMLLLLVIVMVIVMVPAYLSTGV